MDDRRDLTTSIELIGQPVLSDLVEVVATMLAAMEETDAPLP